MNARQRSVIAAALIACTLGGIGFGASPAGAITVNSLYSKVKAFLNRRESGSDTGDLAAGTPIDVEFWVSHWGIRKHGTATITDWVWVPQP